MRSAVVADWIAQSDWAAWDRMAMANDASSRRYERLSGPSGMTVILMDAPPKTCGSQARFVEIATHLRRLNLAAPDVLTWDDTLGLMVLEDLGGVDVAKHLRSTPQDEHMLYQNAVDVLVALQSAPPPANLVKMTPSVGADMLDIAFDWAATDPSAQLRADIKGAVHDLLGKIDPEPSVLSLRDFHAENLIWRPHNKGLSKVGLLDFQDAFVTHPTYDLASLLRDARRDVSPDLLDHLLPTLPTETGDLDTMRAAFHVMAVQRNLRILGIFNRLAQQAGKTGYLRLLPRVRSHLNTDLNAPIWDGTAALIHRAFGQTGLSS